MDKLVYVIGVAVFFCTADAWSKFSRVRQNSIESSQNRLQQIADSKEINMITPEIIRNRNYPAETHFVTTDDGYILQLHRIPYGRNSTTASKRKPVLLMHGLFDTSATWVLNPSDRALAYLLADRGFDVWLGNLRGNKYSVNHTSLPTDHSDFWLFTYDQMGQYDVPACINYILQKTGQDKLSYIGHSMGTTVFWIGMIVHPELNEKVEVMIGLGPIATATYVRIPSIPFSNILGILLPKLPYLQRRPLLPDEGTFAELRRILCKGRIRNSYLCRNFYFVNFGADDRNMDPALVPVINAHVPAGTSVYTNAHFSQSFFTGQVFRDFRRYDWGRDRNLQLYNQTKPLQYDLSKVTAPVYLLWAQKDLAASSKEAAWLATRLGNVKGSYRIEQDNFNHMDFLWAYKAKELVYDRIFPLLPDPSS